MPTEVDTQTGPTPTTPLKTGDAAWFKVTFGGFTGYTAEDGTRLVQISIYQPFAPDIVALVREQEVVPRKDSETPSY